MRTGTSEPRDRASGTLAASVHQADIDHGTWSSRRAIRTRSRLMGGCLAGTITTLSRAEPDDMSDSSEGNRMRS